MRSRHWLVMLAALSTTVAAAVQAGGGQGFDPAATVGTRYRDYFEALRKGRTQEFLDMTHPKVVEALGADYLQASARFAQSIPLKLLEVGKATLHFGKKNKKEVYAVVPHVVEASIMGIKATTRYGTIGVSADGGKTWRFVLPGPRLDEKGIRKMFPDMPAEVELPKKATRQEKLP